MIRRRRRLQPMIPLASMGDIAFLLIIFFMLTSTFMKDSNVQVQLAPSPDVEDVKPTHVSVTVDEEGVIRLLGAELHQSELRSAVEVVLGDSKERLVRVSIDKSLPKRTYLPVIKALSEAGATPMLTGELDR